MAEPYLTKISELISGFDFSFSDEVVLECKHFFSGAALYANGKICASLTPPGFGLKVPEIVRNRLLSSGEGSELRYFDRAPVKKDYVVLAQSIVDDSKKLKSLLIESIEYVSGSNRDA